MQYFAPFRNVKTIRFTTIAISLGLLVLGTMAGFFANAAASVFELDVLNPLSLASASDQPHFERFERFERLTVEDGLPHATVLSVLQDQLGFMWFTTENGLARYDGYEFVVYHHDSNDLDSLSNNNTFAMIESQDGLLWVGTDPGGLNVFDPKTQKFSVYRNIPNDPNSLVNDSIWSLMEDDKGDIWIGTRAGLSRLNRSTGIFTNYLPNPKDPTALGTTVIYRIYQDSDGTIWVGTRAGLSRYNPETDDFTTFANDPENPQSISSSNVWAMLEDSRGNFWVGTRGGGLNLFDRESEIFEAYRHDPNDPTTISDDRLWNIFEDRAGNLWIATENGGLNLFDYKTNTFSSYQHNPSDPYSLSNNDVFWLYEDRSGVLWITSRYGGVNKLYPALQRFGHIRHIPNDPNSLSLNDVYSILAEENGLLWMGSFGGGLNRYDTRTGEMRVFVNDPNNPESLSNNKVYYIHRARDGVLWVATSGGGLNRMDPQTGKFAAFQHSDENPDVLGSSFLTVIEDADDGRLWVGTLGFGLDLFDPETSLTIKAYQHAEDDPNSLAEDTIYDLEVDSSGNVWIATARGGVNLLNPRTNEITSYLNDPQNPDSIQDNTVRALYLDEENQILWAGTTGGLARLDLTTQNWTGYTSADGLPSNTIYGIQPDSEGGLWLSTVKGLSHLALDTGTFRNYDVSDGLQGNQFNPGSSHRGPDGMLYFGGQNGLNYFRPQDIVQNEYLPPVVFTGFELFNKAVEVGSEVLPESIEYLENMVLDHDQSVLTFDFSALSYQLTEKNLYRYKMEGFDQDWSPARNIRHATYTNLKPGTYTFLVAGSNQDGNWNGHPAQLEIKILPAWWQIWWVQFLAGLALVFAIAGVFVRRVRNIQAKSYELEERVAERTQELTTEISRRQNAEDELVKANQALKQQLDEITNLQELLHEQAVRDPLTGLYNRRYLKDFLDSEMPRAHRGNYPVAFLLFDLDYFKNINDTYGHHAGDEALKTIASLLVEHIRTSDFACRYGGEEFLVVMPETNMAEASQRAAQFRSLIENLVLDYEGQRTSLSTSIGVAVYPQHGDDSEKLLKHVDSALYQAKESGRNRVIVYQDGMKI